MLRAMDTDPFEGAACAGWDLAARLLTELARASDALALAEARVQSQTLAYGVASAGARRAERACRGHVEQLELLLAGMPELQGANDAAPLGA
jgi:hypothetical protein